MPTRVTPDALLDKDSLRHGHCCPAVMLRLPLLLGIGLLCLACGGAEEASPSPSTEGDAATAVDGRESAVEDTAIEETAVEDVGTEPDAAPLADVGPKDGFIHPGILVQKKQLDFVKAKIAAGAEPWKSAFAAAKASRFGSLSYAPKPRAIVECGSYSTPDYGCSDEKNDVTAAYTHALLYWFTGDEAYAKKSVEIMNAWSAVLTDHTNSNAPLQSAWCGSVFPRAAELIRASYPKWASADVARFSKMMRNVYLPKVIKGSSANGNWELSMVEATIAIGVYLDDRTTFDAATKMWRKRVPAYLYLASDGATPVPPPSGGKTGAALVTYWYDPGKFVDGLCQETCRDLGHTQLGLAAMINAAETAHIQGVKLYEEEADRLAKGLEFNGQYLDGVAPPSWLCGGKLTDATPTAMWEIALNELEGRLGRTLPHTRSIATKLRPTGTNHHMIWETLTHAGVGE